MSDHYISFASPRPTGWLFLRDNDWSAFDDRHQAAIQTAYDETHSVELVGDRNFGPNGKIIVYPSMGMVVTKEGVYNVRYQDPSEVDQMEDDRMAEKSWRFENGVGAV